MWSWYISHIYVNSWQVKSNSIRMMTWDLHMISSWPTLWYIINMVCLSCNHCVATKENVVWHLLLCDKSWRPLCSTWNINFNAIINHMFSVDSSPWDFQFKVLLYDTRSSHFHTLNGISSHERPLVTFRASKGNFPLVLETIMICEIGLPLWIDYLIFTHANYLESNSKYKTYYFVIYLCSNHAKNK